MGKAETSKKDSSNELTIRGKVTIAFILFVFIIGYATFARIGLVSAFFELLVLIGVTVTVWNVIAKLLHWGLKKLKFTSFTVPAIVAGALVGCCITIPSLVVTYQLRPLKEEFYQGLQGGGEVVRPLDDSKYEAWTNGGPADLDFGGRLDQVVAKRNNWLKEHRFRGFNTWWVDDTTGSSVVGLNFYLFGL